MGLGFGNLGFGILGLRLGIRNLGLGSLVLGPGSGNLGFGIFGLGLGSGKSGFFILGLGLVFGSLGFQAKFKPYPSQPTQNPSQTNLKLNQSFPKPRPSPDQSHPRPNPKPTHTTHKQVKANQPTNKPNYNTMLPDKIQSLFNAMGLAQCPHEVAQPSSNPGVVKLGSMKLCIDVVVLCFVVS